MVDIPGPQLRGALRGLDKVWLTIVAILAVLAVFDPAQIWPTLGVPAGWLADRLRVSTAVSACKHGQRWWRLKR